MEGLAVTAGHACANSTALATPQRPVAVRTGRALPPQPLAWAAWPMPAVAKERMQRRRCVLAGPGQTAKCVQWQVFVRCGTPHTAHALALPCCPEHCGALAANGRTARRDRGSAVAAHARRCAGRRRTDRHACTLRPPATRRLCAARQAVRHRRTRRRACDLLSTMTANVGGERQTTAHTLLAKQPELARRCLSARPTG
jgi:hypothetical protein